MAEIEVPGDQVTLMRHLRKTSFLVGVEEGRWRVLDLNFPYFVVRVQGRSLLGGTHEMDFRLECRGFAATCPFIEPWDTANGRRPPSPAAGAAAPSVVDALKDWHDGQGYGGVYRPWQRRAAIHNNWAQLRPDLAWHAKRDLTFIMEQLYGLVSEQAAWLDCRAAA